MIIVMVAFLLSLLAVVVRHHYSSVLAGLFLSSVFVCYRPAYSPKSILPTVSPPQLFLFLVLK